MDLEVTRQDIEAAAERIAPHVRRTPVLELGEILGGGFSLTLKLDHTQPTGSFKVRGAFSLLTEHRPRRGVAAASGGNFGAAVAHACNVLDLDATIFVPSHSPPEKIDRIKGYGAEVREIPGFYDEAWEACDEYVADTGAFMAHAFDQSEVVAGQGTVAMEITEQVTDADMILVAVGGGGLIGGVASWCRDDIQVVACEPELCASFRAALEAGGPVSVEVGGVASSSLGASRIGEHAWYARRWIDHSTLVADGEIVAAQSWLWENARLAVEPSAATTVAALISGAYRPAPGEQVVALMSGANFDPSSI